MSDRETAERIAERHMGAVSKAWAANLAIDIEDALTTARRESPAPGLVDPRLIEAAQTDATVNAALKYHHNGAPLVEALTAAVLDLAAWKKLWSPEATKAVMMQPPPVIVVPGAPGLVEAARKMVTALDGCDAWVQEAVAPELEALRAALLKETP